MVLIVIIIKAKKSQFFQIMKKTVEMGVPQKCYGLKNMQRGLSELVKIGKVWIAIKSSKIHNTRASSIG
jgi:hypothetical protein